MGPKPTAAPAGAIILHAGDNVSAIVSAAPVGATFYFEPGVYRGVSITPKNDQTFIGAEGAILNGSAVLTNFTQQGNLWVVGGQTQEGVRHATGEGDGVSMRPGYPETVFVNDTPLKPVDALSKVLPGTFYFDYAADKIYIADNPTGQKVEAGKLAYALGGNAQNVTVQNLVIEKYDPPVQSGAIGREGNKGWIMQDNEVRLNYAVGIIGSDDSKIIGNYVHDNGQMGLGGSGDNILVEGNEIAKNGFWSGIDVLWEAGGFKFANTDNLIVRGNYSHDNHGSGMWTDIDNIHTLYEDNLVVHNTHIGITHEISYDAVIRNNTLIGNGYGDPRGWMWGAEIQIQNSKNVDVYGNRIDMTGGGNGVVLIQQNRGSGEFGPHVTTGNHIHDNVIVDHDSKGLIGGVADYNWSGMANGGNTWDDNQFSMSDVGSRFWWGGTFNFAGFESHTTGTGSTLSQVYPNTDDWLTLRNSGTGTMPSGAGNDIYVVDNTGDVVNETDGDGTDTVLSSISFSLADAVHAIGDIENLTLAGSGTINATGNNLDNVLIGNSGKNVLCGLGGGDHLDGGAGTDTASYATSGSGVTVSLALGTGIGGDAQGDLLSNIENLTGSEFNDTLTGNSGNNVLTGLGGNDVLNGGASGDWMVGGTGNDTYVVDNVGDVVDETDGNGLDLAKASISFSLADGLHAIGAIENLTLTGKAAINATGDELDNILTGNSATNILSGGGGSDTLNGGGGADMMYGGTGNDTYVIDNKADVANETEGDGIDTIGSSISFSLADGVHAIDEIENLTLTGTSNINATGNALDNVLTGNGGANVLVGGAGGDTLDGGGGTDTASYATSAAGVVVSLALGVGSGGDAEGDTLSNIENLTGSNLDDTLEGTAGNNKLVGGAGIDTVSYANAAAGANGPGVTVSLALTKAQNTIAAGTDTLSGFENLTGSEFNDTLRGNSANNTITGLAGNDTLTGGGGNDTFVFLAGFGNDTITDFTTGPNLGSHDLIAFDHTIFADFDAVVAASTQSGTSTVITVDAQNSITLANVSVGSLHHDDFAFV